MYKKQTISSQLVTLTYGSIVSQVIKNTENLAEANQALQKIGYNIGLRIVDEYMANNSICSDFRQVVSAFAKDGMKMFLGVTAEVRDEVYELDKKTKNVSFRMVIADNPLLSFVDLPAELRALQYQNILCGVIRGALFTLNLRGKVFVERDALKGSQATILKVEMCKQQMKNDE